MPSRGAIEFANTAGPDPVQVHAHGPRRSRRRVRSGLPVRLAVSHSSSGIPSPIAGRFPKLGLGPVHLAARERRPEVARQARTGPKLQPLAGFRVRGFTVRPRLRLAFRHDGGLVARLQVRVLGLETRGLDPDLIREIVALTARNLVEPLANLGQPEPDLLCVGHS